MVLQSLFLRLMLWSILRELWLSKRWMATSFNRACLDAFSTHDGANVVVCGMSCRRPEVHPHRRPLSLFGMFPWHTLSARLRGRTATQHSKKGSEKVLGRVLGKGSQKGSEKGAWYGFYSKKGKGFWKGVFQTVPRTPPRRVRPLRRAP